MKSIRWLTAMCSLILLAGFVKADVRLPSIFSDHAVLQRDQKIPIWGWADPGEKVSVTIGNKSVETKADVKGNWRVSVGPLKIGAPLSITVAGNNRVVIRDVLVGEVWLCSGQSNMAMTVNRCDAFEKEKAAANYPKIRQFRVGSNPKTTPQQDCPGQWTVCSPDTVGGYSGTAYFFGRLLHKEIGVPIGLINSSVGGTDIAAWTSMPAQRKIPQLKSLFEFWATAEKKYDKVTALAVYKKRFANWKTAVAKAKAAGKKPPRRPKLQVLPSTDRNHPSNLYNGMIAPLVGYTIRGAIWYQGEHNGREGRSEQYRYHLPALIGDWRSRWGQGSFPFLYVQLPNFRQRTDDPGAVSHWALVREGMTETLKVPNTGMAVTIDVGDPKDIHPTNKQDYGKRLALLALEDVYGKKVQGHSPMLVKVESPLIGGWTLRFKNTYGALKTSNGKSVKGFAIQGSDKKWHWAKAEIVGDTVVFSHADVLNAVAIRYAWADNPECNLVNAAGLPASPFRIRLSRK